MVEKFGKLTERCQKVARIYWLRSLENQQKDPKKLHVIDCLRSLENQQRDVKTLHVTDCLRSLENQQKDVKKLHVIDLLRNLENQQKDVKKLHVFDFFQKFGQTKGAIHSTKSSEKSLTGKNGQYSLGKVSENLPEIDEFPKNEPFENSREIPERKPKWNFQTLNIPENVVPLIITGNFRKFKPEFFVERKAT